MQDIKLLSTLDRLMVLIARISIFLYKMLTWELGLKIYSVTGSDLD